MLNAYYIKTPAQIISPLCVKSLINLLTPSRCQSCQFVDHHENASFRQEIPKM
jgi:hypothetical protein